MKFSPASRARSMIRIDSSWSLFPQSPNIMAPRHSGLTNMPVRPRFRCSIVPRLLRAAPPPPGPALSAPGGGGDGRGELAGGDGLDGGARVAGGDRVDRDPAVQAD